jgi:hypothetical protein
VCVYIYINRKKVRERERENVYVYVFSTALQNYPGRYSLLAKEYKTNVSLLLADQIYDAFVTALKALGSYFGPCKFVPTFLRFAAIINLCKDLKCI